VNERGENIKEINSMLYVTPVTNATRYLSFPSLWHSAIEHGTEGQEFYFFTFKFWATVVMS
jgi:hypothetical protein